MTTTHEPAPTTSPPAPSGTGPLDPSEARAFRARCRAFLDEHVPPIAEMLGTATDDVIRVAGARRFQQALVRAGLAGLAYPTADGGAGLTAEHERIWREEFAAGPDVRDVLNIGHGMCLPILHDLGTPRQKAAFMAPLIAADTLWCQLLSEPGAGSDVASLQTRAERDGDEWVINGQKVWTTLAHVADYGILLARTDPDVPKHAGISMFVVDMRDPSVEIRPIHQIDGERSFNEVFFTDTRIPDWWLLGELNNGWPQANSVLMYERAAISATATIARPVTTRLVASAAERGVGADPVIREQLIRLWCEETVQALVDLRARAARQAGRAPGPGGSLGKLHAARIARMTRALIGSVIGPALTGFATGDPEAAWAKELVSSLAISIGGGTDEIQRNIIGERVLGLPREPAVDRDVPFRDLRVGTQ